MKGCSKNINLEKVKIQYVAETKGYYKSLIIENKKFLVVDERNADPSEVNLSKDEWSLLTNLFTDINLETFEKLIGPTSERRFDKRPFGNLFITKNNKTYKTRGFDHKIPPKEIKFLVDLIVEYSKKIKPD